MLFIAKPRADLAYFQHRPTQSFSGRAVLHNAPEYVQARILKSSSMRKLGAEDIEVRGRSIGPGSKGFLVEFSNGHVGMVQRQLGSSSSHRTTAKGRPRWTNRSGQVEKLITMGAPSAAGMHSTVWPLVAEDVVDYLLERLEELNQIRQTTILMVTHDAFTASCCHRVIFLRDGQIFLELSRGGMDRRAFFAQIIRVVSQLGGEMEDVL